MSHIRRRYVTWIQWSCIVSKSCCRWPVNLAGTLIRPISLVCQCEWVWAHLWMSHVVHMSHVRRMSHVTHVHFALYQKAVAHDPSNLAGMSMWMSCVALMKASCHTYGRVMSHIWGMSDVWVMSQIYTFCPVSKSCHPWPVESRWYVNVNELCHTYESCNTYESCHTYEPCHTCTSLLWMSHVTLMNESCHTYKTNHTYESCNTYISCFVSESCRPRSVESRWYVNVNESCHTYECVTSHI